MCEGPELLLGMCIAVKVCNGVCMCVIGYAYVMLCLCGGMCVVMGCACVTVCVMCIVA